MAGPPAPLSLGSLFPPYAAAMPPRFPGVCCSCSPSFPSSPSAAPVTRNGNELQNDRERIRGKIRRPYPKRFIVVFFFLTDALALYRGKFSKKGCHSKLIRISFHSCSHLSYASLYVQRLILLGQLGNAGLPLIRFKSRTRGKRCFLIPSHKYQNVILQIYHRD